MIVSRRSISLNGGQVHNSTGFFSFLYKYLCYLVLKVIKQISERFDSPPLAFAYDLYL